MIYKTYYQTPLGWAEIMADDEAILRIELVDQPRHKDLLDKKNVDSGVLKKCIKELDEYFRGERKNFSVKLKKQGTDFQKNVWDALETIPFGKTVSYEDIAMKIGNKKAVRAVGLANGKNPHWIIVPCHRVIGKSGKLTGYASGLDRKEWLLEHEKRVA